MTRTSAMQKLHLQVPLFVAPMAGGPTTPELVIATCRAGALGCIAGAYLSPEAIEGFVHEVRLKTDRPFGINLFTPHPEPYFSNLELEEAIQATEPIRKKLHLDPPKLQPPYAEDFDRQFETVLKLKPAVLSFVFGLLKSEHVKAARARDILLQGTATTYDEALSLQDSGVDLITLQGVEAGGHRGIFDAHSQDAMVSRYDLLKSCYGKIQVPLVVAGGLMNSSDIRQALSEGASGVQMGTAFLACQESGAADVYKKAVRHGDLRKTKLTRSFSGRIARGIENEFIRTVDASPKGILPFPVQNKFTRDIRTASVKNGSSEYLSLWSGTGSGDLWTGSAEDLIRELFRL